VIYFSQRLQDHRSSNEIFDIFDTHGVFAACSPMICVQAGTITPIRFRDPQLFRIIDEYQKLLLDFFLTFAVKSFSASTVSLQCGLAL
jgi:hypothetical protein